MQVLLAKMYNSWCEETNVFYTRILNANRVGFIMIKASNKNKTTVEVFHKTIVVIIATVKITENIIAHEANEHTVATKQKHKTITT